jgi:hypothetical protein
VAEQPLCGGRTADAAEVAVGRLVGSKPAALQRGAPCNLTVAGVEKVWRTADEGDAPVAGIGEVLDRGDHPGRVVEDDGRAPPPSVRSAERDGRQTKRGERGRTTVVDSKVGDDHTIDSIVVDELPVGGELGLDVRYDLEYERGLPGGQLGLDAGDERGKERVDGEQLGGAGDDEANGMGTSGDESPCRPVGPPIELLDGGKDPLTGGRGDTGPIVEGEGDETLRHTRVPSDVDNGCPAPSTGASRPSGGGHSPTSKPV